MVAPEVSQSRSGLSGYRRHLSVVWNDTAFRWFWFSGSTQSIAIGGMQFLVIGWLVLDITGSSAQLGLVVSLYGGPNIAFLLAAGVITDRFDRRRVIITTQATVAGIFAALAFLAIADLVVFWHICVASALLGATQSTDMTARMTLVADLVSERSILDAVAMQNAGMHAGRIIGAPVAGAIIEVWGLEASLCVIVACFVVSGACIVKIGRTKRYAQAATQSAFRNFLDGLSYVKKSHLIFTVTIIMCSFAAFGMPLNQVIPAVATDLLGVGAAKVGLLLLGSGIGALSGNILLPLLANVRVYRGFLFSVVLCVVVITLFAWSSWFWVSWVLFLLIGALGMGIIWPLAQSMIHMESSPEVRGRVMGVLQLAPASHFLMAFPLALTAEYWGWGLAITGFVSICLAVTLWFALGGRGVPKLADNAL